MRPRVMGWMGMGLVLGLMVPAAARAQTLGDTTAAMGTHSTLSGTSTGRPAATLGTVKSHVGSEGWAKTGGQAAGGAGSRGWTTSTERAGSGWAKAADQHSGAGWAKASDRRSGGR